MRKYWKICCQPSPNSDLSNAFDKDYSAGQAVADLEKLMNEATLLELTHGSHAPLHRTPEAHPRPGATCAGQAVW